MKGFLLFLILVLLVLDFAALDDITTNVQKSYFWEYAMLAVSIPALWYLTARLRKKST